jgi:glycosyltransferase involved in cell wall biosynthesis
MTEGARLSPGIPRIIFYEECTGWGGTEKYLLNLAEGLKAGGVETHVVVRSIQPAETATFLQRCDAAGIQTTPVRGSPSTFPAELRRTASIFRELDSRRAILHFNQQTPASMIAALIGARLVGCTAIATNHLPILGRPTFNTVGSGLWRLARSSLMLTILESPQNLTVAVREGLVPAAKARVVLHGVDTQLFRPADRAVARRSVDLPVDAFVVGTVGRLEAQKSHDVLIRAAAGIVEGGRAPDLHLVIAGEGSKRQSLELLASELGMQDRVHFLGHLEPSWSLYPAFDIFALASAWEGLPLSLLEAMSCGIPVIATDVGGVRDAVTDRSNGFLVPTQSVDELARAIAAMIDVTRRAEMGHAARIDAQRRFDVRRMVDETISIYREAATLAGTSSRISPPASGRSSA